MMQVQLRDFENVPAGGKHQTMTWSFKLPAGVTLSATGPTPLALTVSTVPARSTGSDPAPQDRVGTPPAINAPVTNPDGSTQQSISAALGGWVGGVTYLFTLTFDLSTGDDAMVFNHAYAVSPK